VAGGNLGSRLVVVKGLCLDHMAFTRRLCAPSPGSSAIPMARNCFGGIRDFGFGLINFLNDGKTGVSIDPRCDGNGGG